MWARASTYASDSGPQLPRVDMASASMSLACESGQYRKLQLLHTRHSTDDNKGGRGMTCEWSWVAVAMMMTEGHLQQ